MPLPETTDPQHWHRYFAVEANNRAWALASQPLRSAKEAEELLDCAHASSVHWQAIGTELNVMRARYLVAEAHALVGSKALAQVLAKEAVAYFSPDSTDDWELAYVYVIHAHALSGLDDGEAFATSYARARQAVDVIKDQEDRKIVEQTFSQVPLP